MIKVSVLYPSGAGKNFDIGYYCERHMPMVRKLRSNYVPKINCSW